MATNTDWQKWLKENRVQDKPPKTDYIMGLGSLDTSEMFDCCGNFIFAAFEPKVYKYDDDKDN